MQFNIIFEWFTSDNCLGSVEVNDVYTNNIPMVVNKYVESINNLGYKFSQMYLTPKE